MGDLARELAFEESAIPARVVIDYVAAWLTEWAGEREGFAVVGPFDDSQRVLILQPGGKHVLVTVQDAEVVAAG